MGDAASVKVIDFGLAKVTQRREGANYVEGTLRYMAPEALQNSPPDYPVDYWSIGASAFEMLTGRTPYPNNQDLHAHLALLKQREPDWVSGWQDRSDEAADFCRRCLQQDPVERLIARTALKHPWICKRDHRTAS